MQARIQIRDLLPQDEAPWRWLWEGYLRFYETQLSEEITACAWARLMTSGCSLAGRGATVDDRLVGFSMFVTHDTGWNVAPTCYLENLFVDREERGLGIGRKLLLDLISLAKDRGWSSVYWHTQEGNRNARLLYDQLAQADDFVRYKVRLTGGD